MRCRKKELDWFERVFFHSAVITDECLVVFTMAPTVCERVDIHESDHCHHHRAQKQRHSNPRPPTSPNETNNYGCAKALDESPRIVRTLHACEDGDDAGEA